MVWFNVRYGAQDIFVTRDPGTYAVTAQWLAHHSTGRDPVRRPPCSVTSLAAPPPRWASAPPTRRRCSRSTRTPHRCWSRWVGGSATAWLLKVAPFIGGAALLAFYALARGIVREWWALGAMTLLAVSLPMMHFSRAVFSEPTAMVFLLGGMALLFVCQEVTDRLPLSRAVLLSAVAGLTGGATGLARVDGGIFLLAATGYCRDAACPGACGAPRPGDRRGRRSAGRRAGPVRAGHAADRDAELAVLVRLERARGGGVHPGGPEPAGPARRHRCRGDRAGAAGRSARAASGWPAGPRPGSPGC